MIDGRRWAHRVVELDHRAADAERDVLVTLAALRACLEPSGSGRPGRRRAPVVRLAHKEIPADEARDTAHRLCRRETRNHQPAVPGEGGLALPRRGALAPAQLQKTQMKSAHWGHEMLCHALYAEPAARTKCTERGWSRSPP